MPTPENDARTPGPVVCVREPVTQEPTMPGQTTRDRAARFAAAVLGLLMLLGCIAVVVACVLDRLPPTVLSWAAVSFAVAIGCMHYATRSPMR